MTGTDPETLQRRLRWAAEQLELDPAASPSEVRAAWLRLLAEEGFVPPSEWRLAVQVLLRRQPEGGWADRADAAASLAEEERLRGEVEAFADQFWDFTPEHRRQRWEELTARCAFSPVLRARLRLLERGLGAIPFPSEPDEPARVAALADQVRELFVLRPESRGRSRQAMLRRMQDAMGEWKAAARRLRRAFPALATLGADLLDRVEKWTSQPPRLPKKPPAQPAANTGRRKSTSWPVWLVVGIAIAILRGASSSHNSSSSPTPPPSFPKFDVSKFEIPNGNNPPKDMSPEMWKKLFEPDPARNETLKKLLDEEKRKQDQAKPGGGREKADGKAP
jgi:hypothetical protein